MRNERNDKAILLGLEQDGTPRFEVVDFPIGKDVSERLDWYYKQIECDCIDIVNCYAFNELGIKGHSGKFCMIVDDEGLMKESPVANPLASLIYGADKHGQMLCGKVLVCQNLDTPDGIDTIGLNTFEVIDIKGALDHLINLHNVRVMKERAQTEE